jgi:hypothetical protein
MEYLKRMKGESNAESFTTNSPYMAAGSLSAVTVANNVAQANPCIKMPYKTLPINLVSWCHMITTKLSLVVIIFVKAVRIEHPTISTIRRYMKKERC